MQQDVRFRSKYFTEELRRIFIEDTDSEMEEFEGFTQNELNGNSNPEVMVIILNVGECGFSCFQSCS